MCGLKGHSSNIDPPLKGKDNNMVFDDIAKANILNNTFMNQNTSTALENFPFGPTQTKAIFTMTHVKASEVKKVLKSLPSKSFTGMDNISYRLLSRDTGPLVFANSQSLHTVVELF